MSSENSAVTYGLAIGLIERAQKGDDRAREQLAGITMQRVYRTVLLSVGGSNDTDDLVQNAMLKIFSRLDSFAGENKYFAWIDRISINVVRDHFRKNRFAFSLFSTADEVHEQKCDDVLYVVTPEQELERTVLMNRLSKHFAAVKADYRIPLLMSAVYGYSVPEIASLTDLSIEATKKRIQRGRHKLLRQIKADAYCEEILKGLAQRRMGK